MSNLICNSFSYNLNGAKVPEVNIILKGLHFNISEKPKCGLKQNI